MSTPLSGEHLERSSNFPTPWDALVAGTAIGSSYVGEVVTNPTVHKALVVLALVSGGVEAWRVWHAEPSPPARLPDEEFAARFDPMA